MSMVQDLRAEHMARRARFQAAAFPAQASAAQVPASQAVVMETVDAIPVRANEVPLCQNAQMTASVLAVTVTAHPKVIDRASLPADQAQDKADRAAIEAKTTHERIWQIMRECAAEFGVTETHFFSYDRSAPEIAARFKALWLIRHSTKMSLTKIAIYVNRVDHTTIKNAIAEFEKRNQEFCERWHAENVNQQTLRTDRRRCRK